MIIPAVKWVGREASRMLSGEYRHTVDSKNRLFVPAKHREELGAALKVARTPRENCLRIYSISAWDTFCEKICEKLNGREADATMRFYNRNAATVEPDAQGRITVPAELFSFAGVDKEHRDVVVVGCGGYAEIWSEANYKKLVEEENADFISALLDSVGL